MNPLPRIRQWIRQRRRELAAGRTAQAPLREFVYLDDVSVYSLMASRVGSIATDFTETEANTLSKEMGTSFEGTIGLLKAGVSTTSTTASEQTSQVVRKSIVQTAFKELFELEAGRLVLGTPDAYADATLPDGADLEVDGEWVIDPETLTRGRLLELEVQLEADAVFQVNAVLAAFLEIMQEDLEALGVAAPLGIAEARAVTRVLDKLLTGLVPVRGQAVDFVVAEATGRELIVHRKVIDELPPERRPKTAPLVVVGVAERRLFWKDIRRVLFSNSRYRVLSRISQSGLRDRWTPIKLADVLRVVAPAFESQILAAVGESTLTAIGDAVAQGSDMEERQRETRDRAARSFIEAVAGVHEAVIDKARTEALVHDAVEAGGSLETTEDRRAFYNALLAQIDAVLSVSTTREQAVACRVLATSEAGLGFGGSLVPSSVSGVTESPARGGRFLETELVAIYW